MKIDLELIDVQNIMALIANAPIKGNEAMTVASLQQKLTLALQENSPQETEVAETK